MFLSSEVTDPLRSGLGDTSDRVIFPEERKERKEERVSCLAKVESLDGASWAEAVDGDVTPSLPGQCDLKVSSICARPGGRWDAHLRFKSLRSGCQLGSEEDVV